MYPSLVFFFCGIFSIYVLQKMFVENCVIQFGIQMRHTVLYVRCIFFEISIKFLFTFDSRHRCKLIAVQCTMLNGARTLSFTLNGIGVCVLFYVLTSLHSFLYRMFVDTLSEVILPFVSSLNSVLVRVGRFQYLSIFVIFVTFHRGDQRQ